MINYLHKLLHHPERGWDPIPTEYAGRYSEAVYQQFTPQLLEYCAAHLGSYEGKRVLDLGGGPGQYSIALAARGADVTWFDISANYRRICEARAAKAGVKVHFEMGYLEDAKRLLGAPFDFVLNRVCWQYSLGDASFAKLVYGLVKPGGYGYVETPTIEFRPVKGLRNLQRQLNARWRIKVGHPAPPPGRVAALMAELRPAWLEYDGRRIPANDCVLFCR
ncbi:MAG: class I SAM-dependent methyltransferase [Verrucomicrobiota bacterium]